MRCPDCNKFVPYDTEAEPEVNSEEVQHEIKDGVGSAEVQIEVRRVLPCEECGTELKDSTFNVEHSIEDACACVDLDSGEPEEYTLDIEVSPTVNVKNTDRHGKPIKNPRYMKTMYGVEIHATVTCQGCNKTWEFNHDDELEASSFDELT